MEILLAIIGTIVLIILFAIMTNNDDNQIAEMETEILKMREDAWEILKGFIRDCVVSQANIRGELDEDFIFWVGDEVKKQIDSKEFNHYHLIVKKYGSLKIAIYDLIGGGLIHHNNKTAKKMLEIISANLNKLRSNSYEKAMEQTVERLNDTIQAGKILSPAVLDEIFYGEKNRQ